jgi:hypothetical protein
MFHPSMVARHSWAKGQAQSARPAAPCSRLPQARRCRLAISCLALSRGALGRAVALRQRGMPSAVGCLAARGHVARCAGTSQLYPDSFHSSPAMMSPRPRRLRVPCSSPRDMPCSRPEPCARGWAAVCACDHESSGTGGMVHASAKVPTCARAWGGCLGSGLGGHSAPREDEARSAAPWRVPPCLL